MPILTRQTMNIIRHIPNTITCLNLISGTISIIYSFQEDYKTAALFLFAAAVFDFLDGFAARLLKAYSETGKELDSLSDVVSFGVAPAMMLYTLLSPVHGTLSGVSLTPLLIAAASALRLAKFNTDERQKESFIGMPTPACAILTASVMYCIADNVKLADTLATSYWIIPLYSIAASILLNAGIKMFSFKFKSINFFKNKTRYIFLIYAIAVAATISAVFGKPVAALAIIMASYILANLILAAIEPFRKEKVHSKETEPVMEETAEEIPEETESSTEEE